MRPFSSYTAKQLLPVLNKPVLFHNIDLLIEAGIQDIGIVVGPMKKYVLEAINHSDYLEKAKFTFIEQGEPHGLAHAVLKSKPFLENDNFVMILGDNIFSIDLHHVIAAFKDNKAQSIVVLTKVAEPTRYGIANIENGQLIAVQEKPKNPLSNWALAGLYIFRPSIHEVIETLEPSDRGEYEITDAIQKLIDRKRLVIPWIMEGYWRDIGTLQDLLKSNLDLLNDNEEILCSQQHDSRASLPSVFSPVLIHETAVIFNSTIGPNVVIGRDALVKDSHLENAVVMDGSIVERISTSNTIFSPWGFEEVNLSD